MNSNDQKNFFNFTADAVGYINEIRRGQPRKGEAFVALKATLLEGKDGEEKISADLILRGAQASQVLQSLEDEWPHFGHTGPTWFAGIRLGSLNVKPFTKKDGTPGAVLSGRLLAIKWLKLGKESVQVPPWRPDEQVPAAERKVA